VGIGLHWVRSGIANLSAGLVPWRFRLVKRRRIGILGLALEEGMEEKKGWTVGIRGEIFRNKDLSRNRKLSILKT
jgi:hypothetical protein